MLDFGGLFSNINDLSKRGFAPFTVTSSGQPGVINSNAATVTGGVYSIAREANTLIIGGDFSAVNGDASYTKIVGLKADTGAFIWGGFNPNSTVRAVAVSVSDIYSYLYLGGDFTTFSKVARNYLASWNMRGTSASLVPTAWDPSASGLTPTVVYSLSVYDTLIFLGGNFTNIDGRSSSYFSAVQSQ